MKHLNLTQCCGVLFIIIVFSACRNETDNIAGSPDGVRISYNRQGKGNPAVIFVHGWTNPKEIWDDQVAYFSKRYKAVAIDLAGSGTSGNNRSDWTMEAFGGDVVAVINQLKSDKVVLVGFSMGTAAVVEAANQAPEKVIGLVLVDDLKDPDMKYPPEMLYIMDSIMMDLVTNMTAEKLSGLGFYKHNQDSAYKRIAAMYNGVSHVGWKESLQGYFKWINEDITGALSGLKCPVTAIYSDLEPYNEEASRKYMPGFQAKVITDCGHMVFWDKPEEFNRLLGEAIQNFVKTKESK